MEHRHHGKSSEKFLDADEILKELNFKGNETFMDAGCGDGYISIRAIENYLLEGLVYAVDTYDASIEGIENYKKENGIDNLIAIEADITKTIPGVQDSSVDVVLMLNVFHGFSELDKKDAVIGELTRITNDEGKIAIMDFKPVEMEFGPPLNIRISPKELEEIFNAHNLKKIYLNEDIGKEIPDGKSHYLIIFEKV